MRKKLPGTAEKAKRIKDYRTSLGMKQEDLSTRSGGKISRVEANKIENGGNALTSAKIREGLARALRVSPAALDALIDGQPFDKANPWSSESPADSAPTEEQSSRRYGNLQKCLAFFASENRWPRWVIGAAEGIALESESDPTPKEWETILDKLRTSIKRDVGKLLDLDRDDSPQAGKR